jgi:hypothetical protein
VLAVVDQTHLPNTIKDHVTGAVLGRWLEVRMTSNTGLADSASKGYVVALLYVLAPSLPFRSRREESVLTDTGRILFSVWTFRRTTARFCNLGMVSSCVLQDSTVSYNQMSPFVDFTRLVKINSRCRRRICAWTACFRYLASDNCDRIDSHVIRSQ